MFKKSFIIKESRGSIINDLDQAIEHGYKVELSYLNDKTGNIVTRSLYLFSRGITSRGKTCYRAFQYDPKSPSNGFYSTDRDHGWRLFDVENVAHYIVHKKRGKLWIQGELPEWISRLNVENDKMFTGGTQKHMDIELFMDKSSRSNMSINKRRDAINAKIQPVNDEPIQDPEIEDKPEVSKEPQTSLFGSDEYIDDNPKDKVKRAYNRKPKQDNSDQFTLDLDDDFKDNNKRIVSKKDLNKFQLDNSEDNDEEPSEEEMESNKLNERRVITKDNLKQYTWQKA